MTKFIRGSRPSSGRASNFFDDIYQRKSEMEHRNHVFWESTAKYFDRAHRENKMFQFWNSEDSVVRSEKALAREQMADSMRAKKVDSGHDRPGHVVRREERRFIEEVNSGIVHQGEKDMKKERQIYKLQREAEQKKEAEDLMKQHWKLNDPAFKELQNRKSNAFPKLDTSVVKHTNDKKSEDEENPETSHDKLEELKKFVAEENERLDKNVEKNVKVLSDDKLSHWKESIMKFISDSKALKENEDKIQRQLSRSRLLQDQLDDFRKRHEKLEKKRSEVDLDDYFSRQFRLRLQIKSKAVESNLEDDRRLLDELQTCLRIHEFKSNFRNIQQLLDEIVSKKSFESKKRQETGLLFSEEAEKTWFKDCERWKEESSERNEKFKKLFDDLLEDLRQKLQSESATLESYKLKRITIEETIEKLSQDLQDEEDRLRKEKNKKEAILEDLENLEVEETIQPSTEERFRSKNELGVELVGWNGDPNLYRVEYGDYRRKKVQWFY